MSRATPLPPEERRQAILDAVLPLVLQHGRAVTTKQIAEASGVAEGTIFRVFPSKHELLDEAIRTALEPHGLTGRLATLGPQADLTALVTAIVTVLQDHARTRHRLLTALPRPAGPDAAAHHHHDFDPEARRRAGEVTIAAVAAALEPRRGELSVSPHAAAGAILALAFGALFSTGSPSADAVAHVLLHGIAGPATAPGPEPDARGGVRAPGVRTAKDVTPADASVRTQDAGVRTDPSPAAPDRTAPDPEKG